MKKLFALLIGFVLPTQIGCALTSPAFAAEEPLPEQIFSVTPTDLTLTEGESVSLQITVDPAYADRTTVYYHPSEKKTFVSPDGTVTGYAAGEDTVCVTACYRYGIGPEEQQAYSQLLRVNVKKNETLPAETRTELERLRGYEPFKRYPRRNLELLGVMDTDAPRITTEDAAALCDSMKQVAEQYGYDAPAEILRRLNEKYTAPDFVFDGDPSAYSYWLDAAGNEHISFDYDNYSLHYSKVHADGTVIDGKVLFSLNEDFYMQLAGLSEYTDTTYLQFHYPEYDPNLKETVWGDTGDRFFNRADSVILQSWLLTKQTTANSRWNGADTDGDGRLSAADLTLQKRELMRRDAEPTE